jgi:hypothetical protein
MKPALSMADFTARHRSPGLLRRPGARRQVRSGSCGMEHGVCMCILIWMCIRIFWCAWSCLGCLAVCMDVCECDSKRTDSSSSVLSLHSGILLSLIDLY